MSIRGDIDSLAYLCYYGTVATLPPRQKLVNSEDRYIEPAARGPRMGDGARRPQAARPHRAAERPLHPVRAPHRDLPRRGGGRDAKAAPGRHASRAVPSCQGTTRRAPRRLGAAHPASIRGSLGHRKSVPLNFVKLRLSLSGKICDARLCPGNF